MLNLSNALKILNLSKKYTIYNIENLDIHELKKYYYIAALNYHPDKNIDNKEEAENKFSKWFI